MSLHGILNLFFAIVIFNGLVFGGNGLFCKVVKEDSTNEDDTHIIIGVIALCVGIFYFIVIEPKINWTLL